MSQSLAGMVATWLNIGNGHACFGGTSILALWFKSNIINAGC